MFEGKESVETERMGAEKVAMLKVDIEKKNEQKLR